MSRLLIIPARGGSKRIPRKNARHFCGKPIIWYPIQAALNAGCFDEVMISTDDEEIAAVASEAGAQVPFLRSAEASDDRATTVSVWQEVLGMYGERGRYFDEVCSVMATAPFVGPELLRQVMADLESHPMWDAIMTVTPFEAPIQRALRKTEQETLEMFWPEHRQTRSQDLEPAYYDAAQVYAFRASFISGVQSLREGRLGSVILPSSQVQDIDTEDDWQTAELKFRVLQAGNVEKLPHSL